MTFRKQYRAWKHVLPIAILLVPVATCGWSQNSAAPNPDPLAPVEQDAKLPRVLLLGDSISIGYTVPVRQMLRGQATVFRPATNCEATSKGLEQIEQWLEIGTTQGAKWDVIHFNFGLHDLKYVDDTGQRVATDKGHILVPLEQYRANLRQLVERLQATGAKLIWCTTTPVPEGAMGRVADDAAKYNAVAADMLQSLGTGAVAINDLHAFARPRLTSIQQPANVHFYPEGSRQLAQQVTASIRQALGLPSPTPEIASGFVFEDHNSNGSFDESDQPLEGIRVSNGEQIVSTDAHGKYALPVHDDTVIFVIKPRGYRTPLNDWKLPQFYYTHKPYGSPVTKYPGVSPTGALPASIDFPLYPQREPDQFRALMFGDPQPRTQEEVDFIAHDVVEEVIGTDASFGVTLGDIVFDDLSLFESQAKTMALLGIPWYNVIGNHDINYDAANDHLSDESFERVFGPSYYSFDYGPVHFLVLDDVDWFIEQDGVGKYRGGFGKAQMDFVRTDLASIPPNQLVVLMMHIPLTDAHDRQDLYRLIEKRPFCVSIAAHTHRHEHRMIGNEDGWMGAEPHHHIINVTVSGSWWSGARDERNIPHTTMADGAPNGYSVLVFDGNQYHLDFKAAGRPADYQLSIAAPEVVLSKESEQAALYVNVFNGSVESRVEFKVGETGHWIAMEQTLEEDPYFRRVYDAERAVLAKFGTDEKLPFLAMNAPRPSTHLWRAMLPKNLPAGTHLIHVRASDRHERTFRGKRVLRVE